MNRIGALVVSFAMSSMVAGSEDPTHRDMERLDAFVAAHFGEHPSGGVVLVSRSDRVVLRRAFGLADVELGVKMLPDHVLSIGSITKQFTAAAILHLVESGRIGLEQDVSELVPEFNTHGRTITVEQLLTHTSGIRNFVDRPDFDEVIRRRMTVGAILELTRDMPPLFEPGQGFHYSDTGYILLGALIENVSGVSYAEYLEQELFRPAGMLDTWYADNDRIIPRRARGYTLRDGAIANADFIDMSVPHAAGAVFSTVDDLLVWDMALRTGRVVDAGLLERAWRGRTLADGTRSGYGFGWKVCELAGYRTIEHGGFIPGFLAQSLRLPDAELNVIVLVNNDHGSPQPGTLARRIARKILTGTPAAVHAHLDLEQARALSGRYRISAADWLTISEVDGVLFRQRGDGPIVPMVALSPTILTNEGDEDSWWYEFELDSEGRATTLRMMLRCEPRFIAHREP